MAPASLLSIDTVATKIDQNQQNRCDIGFKAIAKEKTENKNFQEKRVEPMTSAISVQRSQEQKQIQIS